ncbi:hypothetical protein LXL04_014245 [Taraxacum kok-saghyz]
MKKNKNKNNYFTSGKFYLPLHHKKFASGKLPKKQCKDIHQIELLDELAHSGRHHHKSPSKLQSVSSKISTSIPAKRIDIDHKCSKRANGREDDDIDIIRKLFKPVGEVFEAVKDIFTSVIQGKTSYDASNIPYLLKYPYVSKLYDVVPPILTKFGKISYSFVLISFVLVLVWLLGCWNHGMESYKGLLNRAGMQSCEQWVECQWGVEWLEWEYGIKYDCMSEM